MHFSLKSTAVAVISLVSIINGAAVQKVLTDSVDASTLEGKVLFGYQGFFRRPGQGNDHWTIKGGVPGPSTPGDGKRRLPLIYASMSIC